VQRVAEGSLDYSRYRSVHAALRAIGQLDVHTALDLTSDRPTLYVASAAGASLARVIIVAISVGLSGAAG
jgi:hypothetical protein